MKRFLLLSAAILAFCSCRNDNLVYIGTYTGSGSEGIYLCSFNRNTASFSIVDSVSASNPSYLSISEDGRWIYAVAENPLPGAAVQAFERATLSPAASRPVAGADPCYISSGGGLLLSANYSGGNLSVFPLDEDGLPLECSQLLKGSVSPDATMSEAHIHCAVFSPDCNWVLVSDFSGDRILVYGVVAADGGAGAASLELRDSCSVLPDSGPRHLIFDASGRHVYAIGELSGQVTVFDWDSGAGSLAVVQTVQADDAYARGSADIHISPDGRFLYASNRLKDDGIAIFSISDGSSSLPEGHLERVGYCRTGRHPRNFCISPDGEFLLCACRDDDCIEIYRRDAESGLLTPAGTGPIRISKPVYVNVTTYRH